MISSVVLNQNQNLFQKGRVLKTAFFREEDQKFFMLTA